MDIQLASLIVLGGASLAAASFFATSLLRPAVATLGVFASSGRVPLWGGLAFMGIISILALLFLGNGESQLVALLLGFMALTVFGLLDDVMGLSPIPQLMFQMMIALLVVLGITMPEGGITLAGSLPLASLVASGDIVGSVPSIAFWTSTIFGVVFLIAALNAINWIDGIDGLASATGVTFFGMAGVISLSLGFVYPGIFLLFAGATLLGFFAINKPPARIYMGTAGSMGIGFVAASVPILHPILLPVILALLALPFGDALWVIIKRLYARRSPLQGDRRHLHYQLIDAGWKDTHVIALYVGATMLAGVAISVFGSSLVVAGASIAVGMLLTIGLNIFFGPLVAPQSAELTSNKISFTL